MKFDPNFIIPGLNNEPLQGTEDQVHAGKLIAAMLYNSNSKSPLKMHDWALKLYNKQPIEMEATDLNLISQLVTDNEFITVAVKAPVLQYIDKIRMS